MLVDFSVGLRPTTAKVMQKARTTRSQGLDGRYSALQAKSRVRHGEREFWIHDLWVGWGLPTGRELAAHLYM